MRDGIFCLFSYTFSCCCLCSELEQNWLGRGSKIGLDFGGYDGCDGHPSRRCFDRPYGLTDSFLGEHYIFCCIDCLCYVHDERMSREQFAERYSLPPSLRKRFTSSFKFPVSIFHHNPLDSATPNSNNTSNLGSLPSKRQQSHIKRYDFKR